MVSQRKHRRWVSLSALYAALIAGGASLSALVAPANAQLVTMVAVAGQDCNPTGGGGPAFVCSQGAGTVNLPAMLTVDDANRLSLAAAPPAGVPVGKGQLWELQPTGETDGSGNKFVYIISGLSGFALTNTPKFQRPPPSLVLTPFTHANTQKWLMFHVAASFAPGAFDFSNNINPGPASSSNNIETELTVDGIGDVFADVGVTTAWQITSGQAISKVKGVK
jgi:hypothetical protein